VKGVEGLPAQLGATVGVAPVGDPGPFHDGGAAPGSGSAATQRRRRRAIARPG
jgi:hypothetical protein